ncbi:hypothetical protein J4401_00315 [Candidatus Woesearchaeota archaeon]|nr:hypothetical protein [Candidatus Woesearchaeota archaeon]
MKDAILSYISQNGPSLPNVMASSFGQNSLFVSAYLSELKELGKLKISNIKVGGGSPLYYLPGQEQHLQKFADNLGEKEKKVYELLKEKKILKDSTLVPVFRAAIRAIKDFAFPLLIEIKGNKELFWKWYLSTNEEVSNILKSGIENKQIEKTIEKQEKKEEKSVEPELYNEVRKEEKNAKSDLYKEVSDYFSRKSIIVLETIKSKKSELEFIIEVPTGVGNLRYFAKAKGKKTINDGDISSAFIEGQSRRLPVLFISKGSLTKKAKEMMDKEFKGMHFSSL